MATFDPTKSYLATAPNYTNNPSVTGDVTGAKLVQVPTVPTNVPTKAPSVPTAVVSSGSAANYITDKVVPTLTKAQTAITQSQLQKQATSGIGGVAPGGVSINVPYGQPQPQPTTPEQQIADTPDTGYKWAYGADGSRTQIPLTSSATQYGMFDSNPTVTPVKPIVGEAQMSSGTSIKQFNDNTYGMFDVQGNYLGVASESQFRNARNAQDTLDKLNLAVNGQFPLNPNQQAQINAVKEIYANLVKRQEEANAQLTGGTTVAQNLYGIGNTVMAMGAIKQTVDDGISKVADIQSRMNSDVSKMTMAFESDNLKMLKDAYESFSSNQRELQDNLDKIQSQTVQIERDQRQQEATAQLAIDNDIRDLVKVASANGADAKTIQKMNEALLNHDISSAVNAGGNLLTTAPGVVGEYYAYTRDAQNRGLVPMSFDEYQTKDANRKARIAAAGAQVVAGTTMTTKQQQVFNSIVDKQNKSPLIMANDRAMILKKITDEVALDPSNSALQVSFIYSMIQALDTYQSAVREGEINLVEGTQGLGEKLQNLPSKIQQGNPLNPAVIQRYVAVSKTLTDSINNAAQAKKNTFKAQAKINGIETQYDEWDTTISELNKTTTKDEVLNEGESDPLNLGIPKNATSTNNPLGI